jgi:hypothetical protein
MAKSRLVSSIGSCVVLCLLASSAIAGEGDPCTSDDDCGQGYTCDLPSRPSIHSYRRCAILESYPMQLSCGTGGDPPLETCEQVRAAIDAELAKIQACDAAEDCGQVLTGTSCGCTRNLVARLDADITRFNELMALETDLQCEGFVSTCDCPAADGYACIEGRCTWNYVSASVVE